MNIQDESRRDLRKNGERPDTAKAPPPGEPEAVNDAPIPSKEMTQPEPAKPSPEGPPSQTGQKKRKKGRKKKRKNAPPERSERAEKPAPPAPESASQETPAAPEVAPQEAPADLEVASQKAPVDPEIAQQETPADPEVAQQEAPADPETQTRAPDSPPDTIQKAKSRISGFAGKAAADASGLVKKAAKKTGDFARASGTAASSAATWIRRASASAKEAGGRVSSAVRETGRRVSASVKETGGRVRATTKETGERIRASAKETGQRISSSAKEAGERVSASVKETGQRISSSTKETGQRVSSSVKEAGEHISASVKEAGERISSSAKVTGQRVSSSVKEAGERVESSAKETAERVRTSAKESGERVRASAKETGERMSAGYGKFRKIAAGKLRYLTARLRPGRKTLAPPPPWVRFLLAACTAASLGLNMGYPKYDALPEVVWNLLYSVSEKTFVPLLISILALYRYVDANRDLSGRPRLLTFLNAFIAAVWLMAEGFRAEGGVEILFATPGQCVKSAVYAVGVFAGLNALSEALVAVLGNRNSAVLTGSALTGGVPAPNASSGGSVRFRALRERWNRRPFGIYFFTLLLLWTPHLIASYPGNPTPSAYNQIAQVFGVMPWTNFHPPFSTLILGSIVKLGSYVSGNFGLFLYTLTQAVVFAAVLGWQSCLLRDLDAPVVLRRLVFAACALSPYYTSYITVLLKDNFYSYCFLLYVIELIYMAYLGGRYYKSLRHLFLLTVGEMGVILLRHNGKYVVYPVLILAVWNVLRALTRSPFRQRGEGRYAAAMALCMALPVAAAFVVSDSLSFDNPIAVGSVREALSLPFQQTARYVRDFGDEVTPAERRAIDAVLDYEHLAENYKPRLADPVKDTYREEASGEDLANYFLVWLVQFYKHPSVYFLATIQQNYYIVYPFVPNDAIFSGLDYPDQERITKPLGVHPVESLAAFHRDMDRWYHMCFQIPGLNLLCHLATYVLIFLWLWLYAWKRKLREWTIPAFPVLLSLAVVIAAPVIQGHPRYAFPILYSVPALTAFWSYLARRQGEGESAGETGIAGGVFGAAIAGNTSGAEIPDGFGGQSGSEIVSDVPENPDAVAEYPTGGGTPSEGLNNDLNNALSDSEP